MTFDRNEFFRQATLQICGSLDINSALTRCLTYIKDYIPVDVIDLRYFDPSLNVLKTVGVAARIIDKDMYRALPWFEGDFNERMLKWVNIKKIKIFNQPDSDSDFTEIFRKFSQDLKISVMVMSLELEGNRVGVVGLRVKGNNRYTEKHANLLLMLHEPFAVAMANALKHQEVLRLKDMLADDNQYLRQELQGLAGKEIVGADFGLKNTMTMVRQVAPLDSPVLLLGETGVGKELIAKAIHYSSPRSEGPLIEVNCGAIPDTLLDSELFGHEKGAFTGALMQKMGRFERANKGTIFLDEIGELPLNAQVRLLRVIQNKEIERVGGTHYLPVDIRIISATNKNLEEMIRTGGFREDLWYRLNVFPIIVPPLRQRKEDVPALVHYFIEHKSLELRVKKLPVISPKTLERLMEYHWPGNVRELENLLERALIQHRGGAFDFDRLLTVQVSATAENNTCIENTATLLTLDELNARYIRQALSIAGGKIHGPGGTAELLGINPNTLRKKMKKLGVSFGRKKK